jgi:hypothetical protein
MGMATEAGAGIGIEVGVEAGVETVAGKATDTGVATVALVSSQRAREGVM